MKFNSMIVLFLLVLPNLSKASTAKCQIIGAKESSVFTPFVGGTILIDLGSGESTLFQAGGPLEFAVISSDVVSSFRVARSACTEGSETIVRQDGSLRSMLFRFSNCVHRDSADSDLVGYVRADVGFDLTSNTGKYREIFLTPRGPVPTAFVDFHNCSIQ